MLLAAMPKDITSVYVPVKTPDHKVMAVLAAVLVHIGVVGFILYTNHPKPLNDPPMQMSLVTPEQLAMIQGQATANRQAQAAQAAANATATNPTPTTAPAMASVNNDLAARQAKWQREQAAYAAQLDKQAMQDQQNFNNQIKQVQMSHVAELNKLKTIQANPEANQPLASPPVSKSTKNASTISWQADGSGKETGDTSQSSSAGSGSNANSPDTGMSRGDYKNQVATIIQSKWQTAPGDKGKQLQAHFDISATGEISNIVVDGADSPLKNALYQAIQSANPLPPPPSKHLAAFAHNNTLFIAQ